MGSFFTCPRCGNNNPLAMGTLNGIQYCRQCITFNGQEVEDDITYEADPKLDINYELSEDQKKIAYQLIDCFIKKENVLIHAVTGAGKTELVYYLIQHVLKEKLKIGFAIPRKDVVIELALRFQKAFPNLRVIAVYGGHHDELLGDLTVLTTHQLFRYPQYFDLLIVDEYDAFPYDGNQTLQGILNNSLKGPLIALTATPTKSIINQFERPNHKILTLWTRYHQHPLPVPQIMYRFFLFKIDLLIDLINKYKKKNKPLLIFVPTILIGEKLYKIIAIFCKNGAIVHSKCENRAQIISDFRQGKTSFLISTSVLERGITLSGLQVVVYDADHELFNDGVLIQMAGRVGRRINEPFGDVIFITSKKTKDIKKAIEQIEYANTHL